MSIKSVVVCCCPSLIRPLIDRVEASPLGYRLARGAFWSMTGGVIARGLGLIASILVARMLGKSGFGELGIIQSTVGMFGTFAGFGLGLTATKFIAEYRTVDPEKAGRIRGLSNGFAWITGGITALILFFMAPWLAVHTLAAPDLKGLLQVGSLLLLLTAVSGVQMGILSGFESFKTVAKISLWTGLASFPLMVAGVYLAGLSGAVWAMVLAMGLNWFFNHVAIRSECNKADVPYAYGQSWKEVTVLWRFALPAMISGMFITLSDWALTAMLVNEPGGYGQMGLFNAARQWHVLILYVPLSISNMTLPILSNLLGEGNRRQYNKLVMVTSLLLTGLAFGAALPVALFSTNIMRAYGHDFIQGERVLLLVCFYSCWWAANIVIGQVLWSTGSSGLAMILAAARAVILLGSFLLVTPKNACGIALAYTITYVLMTAYQGILSARSVDKSFLSRSQALQPIEQP